MAQEIDLGGVIYISSKRAAEKFGYAQDYVGQIARAGHVEAKKVSGLWYVQEESLRAYKDKADQYKPEPPRRVPIPSDPDAPINFDGREYVSAIRAAEITGYNSDYVGQLARAGKISSRQIGNRWYVDQLQLSDHKREKDALLAAVQAGSVGLHVGAKHALATQEMNVQTPAAPAPNPNTHFKYMQEEQPLIPSLAEKARAERERLADEVGLYRPGRSSYQEPMKIVPKSEPQVEPEAHAVEAYEEPVRARDHVEDVPEMVEESEPTHVYDQSKNERDEGIERSIPIKTSHAIPVRRPEVVASHAIPMQRVVVSQTPETYEEEVEMQEENEYSDTRSNTLLYAVILPALVLVVAAGGYVLLLSGTSTSPVVSNTPANSSSNVTAETSGTASDSTLTALLQGMVSRKIFYSRE